jgi:hypothetical protein
VRDMRTIAEALADQGGKSQDADALTARVRVALGPSIFQTVNGTAREMPVMVLDSQLEQMLLTSMQGSPGGLEPSLMDAVISRLSGLGQARGRRAQPGAARSQQRAFVPVAPAARTHENFYILAYEEIPPEVDTRGRNYRRCARQHPPATASSWHGSGSGSCLRGVGSMRIERYTGNDTRTAMARCARQLGADALILANRRIGNQVEVTAAIDVDEVLQDRRRPP